MSRWTKRNYNEERRVNPGWYREKEETAHRPGPVNVAGVEEETTGHKASEETESEYSQINHGGRRVNGISMEEMNLVIEPLLYQVPEKKNNINWHVSNGYKNIKILQESYSSYLDKVDQPLNFINFIGLQA